MAVWMVRHWAVRLETWSVEPMVQSSAECWVSWLVASTGRCSVHWRVGDWGPTKAERKGRQWVDWMEPWMAVCLEVLMAARKEWNSVGLKAM